MSQKVVVITGASRGIGRATALELSKRGYRVHATMRNPSDGSDMQRENIVVHALDVTQDAEVEQVIRHIYQQEKRIDILINNAGYGVLGPVDSVSIDQVKRQFDVNLFGIIRMLHAVLPIMRKQKNGHVINISSILGVISSGAFGIYSATKFAVEAISASLAATIFPWNIKVTVVEPGPVSTEFAENVSIGEKFDVDLPYASFLKKHENRLKSVLVEGQPPEEVATLIANILEAKEPHFRYQTSEKVTQQVEEFISDPSGETWLKEQKDLFSDWFHETTSR